MRVRPAAGVFFLWAGVVCAAPAPPLPCRDADKDCAKRESLSHPARRLSNWNTWLDQPVTKRNGAAPDMLLGYLGLQNIADGLAERPRAIDMTPELKADFDEAVKSIPERVWRAVDKRLAGIFFLQDLGGTAMCDYVKGGWFTRERGFIVLDMAVLARFKANEWATWKENTPFKSAPGIRLEAKIEEQARNTRANAIRYILLHELGHVLSIGNDVHPRWDEPPPPPAELDRYPFAKLSWRIKEDRSGYESVHDPVMPKRSDIVYYFGARLEARDIASVYAGLQRTSYPTLYAATIPGDDFAESFVSYVHTVIDKRPWEIRVHQEGQPVQSFGTCWNDARCAQKRKVLEALLPP